MLTLDWLRLISDLYLAMLIPSPSLVLHGFYPINSREQIGGETYNNVVILYQMYYTYMVED